MTIFFSVERVEADPDGQGLCAQVRLGQQTHSLHYHSPDLALESRAEAWIATGLLPAMKQHARMQLSGTVSPRFLDGAAANQELLRQWKPGYGQVSIEGLTPQADKPLSGGRVGLFFSTGVDSFYSLLRHSDEISDLIYLAGFDVTAGDWTHYQATAAAARQIAAHYGKRLILVETDVRRFTDSYVFWGLAHGAVMAGIGHLLGPQFQRIYIAASLDRPNQIQWGTHPQLDPNWSSERLEFAHDGSDVRRIDKVACLAQDEFALGSLRVCLHPPGKKPNCGRCEKCVRTMIALQAVGALERCPTFAAPLDLRRVYRLYAAEDRLHQAFVAENLAMLEQTGTDPALQAALRRVQAIPRPVKRLLAWLRRWRKK